MKRGFTPLKIAAVASSLLLAGAYVTLRAGGVGPRAKFLPGSKTPSGTIVEATGQPPSGQVAATQQTTSGPTVPTTAHAAMTPTTQAVPAVVPRDALIFGSKSGAVVTPRDVLIGGSKFARVMTPRDVTSTVSGDALSISPPIPGSTQPAPTTQRQPTTRDVLMSGSKSLILVDPSKSSSFTLTPNSVTTQPVAPPKP